jgi:G2/mitotic-specific cyclin 1/2
MLHFNFIFFSLLKDLLQQSIHQPGNENQPHSLLRGKVGQDTTTTTTTTTKTINTSNTGNNFNTGNIDNTKIANNKLNVADRQVLTNLQSSNSNSNSNSQSVISNPASAFNILHNRPIFTNTVHIHGIASNTGNHVNATTTNNKNTTNNNNTNNNNNNTNNSNSSQIQSQSSHLTAISGVNINSPFLKSNINYDLNPSQFQQPTKQIKIKPDNENIKEQQHDNQDSSDEETDENDIRFMSMAERTTEQIQDENRRMSLKRGPPIDTDSIIDINGTQEMKRLHVTENDENRNIYSNDENRHEDEHEDNELVNENENENENKIDHVSNNELIVENLQSWDDLDSGDFDDPLMVSEYVNEIFEYLHELELKTLPDANYLQHQRTLRPKMRSILVDWLVEVHLKFKLLPETLYLSINIMDRFLSKEVVQVDRLQLLATGSLFIAAKYEEVYSPSIRNYAYVTDGAFSEDEILGAERFILEILNFNMSYPNPMNFLRRISKADDYDVNSRTIGKYLLEITIIDHKFIGYLPSLCASSSMFIARKMIGKNDWNSNLIHYSGNYNKNDMEEICLMIIDYLVSPIVHEEFFKKYASRKFMRVSILARQWAKKVLSEGRNIMEDEL